MRKQKTELISFPEIIFSIAVISILLETAHFIIYTSGSYTLLNGKMLFGLVGSNSISIVVALVFLFGMIFLLARSKFSPIPAILIIAGAFVNIIDRYNYGGALDYISLLGLPVFNMSDLIIVLGVLIFCGQKTIALIFAGPQK